eukprot:5782705-Alexandrium_andersonii.AAC.1
MLAKWTSTSAKFCEEVLGLRGNLEAAKAGAIDQALASGTLSVIDGMAPLFAEAGAQNGLPPP